MLNLILPLIAFATALLSGIFGMAGGLVLMGALALLLPISAAFVTHGIIQTIANGWRAILDHMSDASFLGWTRWLVSLIGLICLLRGLIRIFSG